MVRVRGQLEHLPKPTAASQDTDLPGIMFVANYMWLEAKVQNQKLSGVPELFVHGRRADRALRSQLFTGNEASHRYRSLFMPHL